MFGLQSSPNRRKHARDQDRRIRRDSVGREVKRQLQEQADDWADEDAELAHIFEDDGIDWYGDLDHYGDRATRSYDLYDYML